MRIAKWPLWNALSDNLSGRDFKSTSEEIKHVHFGTLFAMAILESL